jgi:hypothetical protein
MSCQLAGIIVGHTARGRQDRPWLLGLILPSDIMMARIDLDNLEALALAKAGD